MNVKTSRKDECMIMVLNLHLFPLKRAVLPTSAEHPPNLHNSGDQRRRRKGRERGMEGGTEDFLREWQTFFWEEVDR